MARALYADLEISNKALQGREKEIRHCTRCLECLDRVANFLPIRCAINPVTGRETELQHAFLPRGQKQKYVLIAGGGPAGIQAAITAASRGHRVTLYEKNEQLGGSINYADYMPFKKDLKAFRDYLLNRVSDLPVKVMLKSELDDQAVSREDPDVLIMAVGAEPVLPNIKSTEEPPMVWVGDALADRSKLGESVVIVGAGAVGSEAALAFAFKGKKVTIVEEEAEVAADLNLPTRLHLLELLEKHSVELRTLSRFAGVTAKGAAVEDNSSSSHEICTDTVVFSLGFVPKPEMIEKVKGLAPEVYAVGDCARPVKVMQAIHQGFNASLQC